ncbi:DUF5518 domain-containing protein [Haloparvum sp. PAK95]|uniref:DUF5518 domain-containing protein n=1 Tax=Haloparvum sp. PAK95 TaxID=3418962 RepID=UPI003D2EC07E
MVPDVDADAAQPSTEPTSPPPWERDYGTPINALIGGLAGVVLSFLPGAPILGGAIAAYLERGESRDGLVVGAIAGAVMLVPYSLFVLFVLLVMGVGGAPIWFVLVAFGLLFASALYTVGLSALGGYLGWYLRTEF